MPTITTGITDSATFLITRVTDGVAEVATMIRDQGGRFVVMGTDLEAGRRLVLSLNTGNGGVAVYLPGDWSLAADREAGLAECRRCWGDKPVLLLLPPEDPVITDVA